MTSYKLNLIIHLFNQYLSNNYYMAGNQLHFVANYTGSYLLKTYTPECRLQLSNNHYLVINYENFMKKKSRVL